MILEDKLEKSLVDSVLPLLDSLERFYFGSNANDKKSTLFNIYYFSTSFSISL